MRVDNLLYLIGGELKNSPTITSFANVELSAQKVKRGDLFFARDKDSIDIAVKNGAYAIVFEGWAQMIDPEIAWIQVPSLEDAALKLLRFFLINERTPLHLLNPTTYDLAKQYIYENELLFATGDPLEDLERFIKKEPVAFVVKKRNYLSKLALESSPLQKEAFRLIVSWLFESSFIFGERYYDRIPVAPLLLNNVQTVLELATTYNLTANFTKPPLFHFHPHFIDSRFRECEFGGSSRAIIYEEDYNEALKAKTYLLEKAPWAKTLFISDQRLEGFLFAPDIEGLKEILYNRPFNYALFAGTSFHIEDLAQRSVQKSLF